MSDRQAFVFVLVHDQGGSITVRHPLLTRQARVWPLQLSYGVMSHICWFSAGLDCNLDRLSG